MPSSLWKRLVAQFGFPRSRMFGRPRFTRVPALTRRTAHRAEFLESRVLLTSGLTEIIPHSGGYSVPEAGLEIEIGGLTPGNTGGSNIVDGFDQLQVSGGNAVLSGGPIDVRLVNNFTPNVGDRFNFLQIANDSSITGTFNSGTGLFAFPAGDRYFDIVSDGDGGLSLEVKAIPAGLTFTTPVSQLNADALGRNLRTTSSNPRSATLEISPSPVSQKSLAHLRSPMPPMKHSSPEKMSLLHSPPIPRDSP